VLAYVPPATARLSEFLWCRRLLVSSVLLFRHGLRAIVVTSRPPALPPPSSAAELPSVSLGLGVSSVEINAALFRVVSVRLVDRVPLSPRLCFSGPRIPVSSPVPLPLAAIRKCTSPFDLLLWSYLLLDCAQPFYIFRCQAPGAPAPPTTLLLCWPRKVRDTEPIIKLSGAVKVY
jgi:hypothetical protein